MKLPIILSVSAALLVGAHAAEDKPLSTQKEKASYGVGMNVAKRFKSDLADLDIEAFMRGVRDVLTDQEPAVTEEELQIALQALRTEFESKATEAAAKMKTEGAAFLAENKTKPGVKTTASGLQYKVLKEGTGASPKATDQVQVHYSGKLIDGTEFDSSYKRGEPITFPVTGVIPGWVEALQMMKEGAKWQIFIPSDLAYGESGQGPIPGNAPLIFEVELLDVVSGQPSPGQPQ